MTARMWGPRDENRPHAIGGFQWSPAQCNNGHFGHSCHVYFADLCRCCCSAAGADRTHERLLVDRAEVTVYLCKTVSSAAGCSGGAITDEQKTAVQDRLASATLAPYVQKLYFVDQQTAYKDFTRQFSGAPNLAFVTPDLLPAQF